jgi:Tfp pilus assembly protein PilF
VEFPFVRAGRSIVTAAAFALLTGLVSVPFAAAQTAGAQQPAAGQAGQPQKNWKDRGEYDLYVKITQTQDPKQRLELLNTWRDKYPQTDFHTERDQAYIGTLGQIAQSDPTQRQPLIDKCEEVLKSDPTNFTAAYYLTLIGPQVGGNSPPADLVTQVQSAAHTVLNQADTMFAPDKKKPGVSDADWAKAKNQIVALAHTALGWAASANKDTATAENEYKASLEANPDQGTVSAAYAKLLIDEKKYPEGLFEYARAAQYTGPGPALPAATRQQLLDYFNKAYKDYHGSADGADQLLAQAKTNALPQGPLNITSQADMANAQADAMNKRIASDPQFKLWYTIKQNLTGDSGDQFFNSNVKDAEIPGGAEGVKNFTGTVISIDPPDRPTKVTLGVEDPTKPDTTLEFSQPLPASALDKIKVGQTLDFSGVADSYTKDPYMLTFKDPTIPGAQARPWRGR